jgi:DNA-directed RNA polymerase specialized sigma24 family protein
MPSSRPHYARDYYREHRGLRLAEAGEGERRRAAERLLRLTAATAAYGAGQVGDGLGPAAARQAMVEAAAELEAVARELRILARARDKPTAARRLAAQGWTQAQIAARLGVSERSVRYWVSRAGR